MSLSCRLGYIVTAKPELFEHLKIVDSDLDEYFREGYIVVTEELDYEEYFESWKKLIIQKCKTCFIRESVYSLDYSKEELVEIFGDFSSDIDLFDKWWTLTSADCSEIPTDWK